MPTEAQVRRRRRKREARDRIRRGLKAEALRKKGGVRFKDENVMRTRREVRRRLRNQERLARRRARTHRGGGRRYRLLKQREPSLVGLGGAVNNVMKGAGSQRRGKKYRIVYDQRKRAFYHDYGRGTGRIRLRRSNPLTGQYKQLLAAKRANSRRDRVRPLRPRSPRAATPNRPY